MHKFVTPFCAKHWFLLKSDLASLRYLFAVFKSRGSSYSR